MIGAEVDGLRAKFPGLIMALALALAGCGGVVDSQPSEASGSGGGAPVPNPGSVGGSGSTEPPSKGSGGSAQPSGAGGSSIHPPLQVGGSSGVGPDGCPLPWWGTPLEGVPGLLSCSDPYDPAMLAYGQSERLSCQSITGPVDQDTVGDNLSCCYRMDDRECGNPNIYDECIEIPYFGDGSTEVSIPDSIVSFAACDAPPGVKLKVTTQESRAEHLIGVWLRCGSTVPPFNGNAIVFRGDGTFQVLQTDEQGRLAPAAGCNQSGLWGFNSNPGQLNLHMGEWSVFWAPQFASGPPRRFYVEGEAGTEAFVEATPAP